MARPEQTEKATPKRRGEVRSQGRVPRSAELAPAFIFLAGVVIIHVGFMYWLGSLYALLQGTFTHIASSQPLNIYSAWNYFGRGFAPLVPLLSIFFFASVAIGYGANVLQFGFLFTPDAADPKFSQAESHSPG